MGYSNLVTFVRMSPNCNSPRNEAVSKITIHHMAGNMTLQAFGELVSKKSRRMSANYAIDSDGNIGCFCDEGDRSWCSSSSWNDNRAITIEVANDTIGGNWHVSDKAYHALINLCVDICKRYGFTINYTGDTTGSLTEHRMFSSTACPGPYLHDRMFDIMVEVNAALRKGGDNMYTIHTKNVDTLPATVVWQKVQELQLDYKTKWTKQSQDIGPMTEGDKETIKNICESLGVEYSIEES